jgi:hypothetical protein
VRSELAAISAGVASRIPDADRRLVDVLQRLLEVDRHAHGVRVVVEVVAEGLVEPVDGIGPEEQTAPPVEAVDRPEEREAPLLDQVLAVGRVQHVALER